MGFRLKLNHHTRELSSLRLRLEPLEPRRLQRQSQQSQPRAAGGQAAAAAEAAVPCAHALCVEPLATAVCLVRSETRGGTEDTLMCQCPPDLECVKPDLDDLRRGGFPFLRFTCAAPFTLS